MLAAPPITSATAAATIAMVLVFLSRFLLVSSRMMSGTNAKIATIRPMLFHSQNLVGFFLEAGSIWFAFFQSWEPMMTQTRSRTMNTIRQVRVFMKVMFSLPAMISTARTSKTMAATQRITAPTRRPVALPTGFAFLISLTVVALAVPIFFFSAMLTLLSSVAARGRSLQK